MPSSPQFNPPEKKDKDLPSDSGWDTADTVTSMPDLPPIVPPAVPTPKGGIAAQVSAAPLPPPTPPAPIPTPTPSPVATTQAGRDARDVPPAAASTSPAASLQGLSAPMREEVWAIVRAAINEATTPMLSKQRELEERVMRAEQAAATANATAAAAASRAPSPGSTAPDSITNPNYRPPQKSMRLSVPPGVYGVAVIDPGEKKPDIDLTNVGPIHDMPNFGGKSKTMGRIVAVLMILLVVAAVVSMIASRA